MTVREVLGFLIRVVDFPRAVTDSVWRQVLKCTDGVESWDWSDTLLVKHGVGGPYVLQQNTKKGV